MERRDSKTGLVIQEDESGIPTTVVEAYRASCVDSEPIAHDTPAYLMSMSGFDKPSGFEVYSGGE